MPERFGRNGFTGHFVPAGVHLKDAAADIALPKHVESSSLHSLDERLTDVRLRTTTSWPASIAAVSGFPNPVRLGLDRSSERHPKRADGRAYWRCDPVVPHHPNRSRK